MIPDIKKIFECVGKEYGYKSINTVWMASADFKLAWTRVGGRSIDFFVSDYLKDVDEFAIEEAARELMDRICAGPGSGPRIYPDSLVSRLTSPEFRDAHIQTYLDRAGDVSEEYCHVDLDDCMARLVDSGQLSEDEIKGITARYFKDDREHFCKASPFMRCVLIDRRLDNGIIPKEVIEYAVLFAVKHANDDSPSMHDEDIVSEIKELCPDWQEYTKDLHRFGLKCPYDSE